MQAADMAMKPLLASLLALAAPVALAHDEAQRASSTAAVPASTAAPSLAPFLGVIGRAPDFTLQDHTGAPIRLGDLRGRTVLLSFIFTHCSSACPLLTQQMQRVQAGLAKAGLFPARVALLTVTVDPDRDSADVLDRYAQRFDARPGWHFLRDRPERLQPMLAAYHEWTSKLPGGDLDHPARVYLIDPGGRIREIYSLAFFDERQALLDIQAVDREK
jgi:cytochrome oxidase Cu insertion factor (SCO1/SenC/PrrC family)